MVKVWREFLSIWEDPRVQAEEYRENLERKRRLQSENERESLLPVGTKVLDVPIHAGSNGGNRRKHKGGAE